MAETDPDIGETLTIALPCACAACTRRRRLPEVMGGDEFRITSFFSRRCSDVPFTVMIARENRLVAVGHGDSEEVALYEALRELGVAS